MTQSKNCFTAMTAIAAVLAFATPAMAQDSLAPVPAAPDPLGATPPTTEPVPSTEPAPSTTTPVDPLSATTAVEAAPTPGAESRATPRAARTSTSVRSAQRARPNSRTAAPVASAPAEPAPVEAIAPLAAAPVVAPPPTAAIPAPLATPPSPPAEVSNDVLPLAAGGGLALLALIGAGVALRRRKRRDEDFALLDEPTFEQPSIPAAYAEPMREPSMTRAAVSATPAPAAAAASATPGPTNTLPDGFDLSRFGPHVQAAYRGPTEDNPSLSLKNRLRRASAMDQMARTDGEPAQPAVSRPLAAATSARDTGAVVSKIRPAPSSSGGFILGGDALRAKSRPVTQH